MSMEELNSGWLKAWTEKDIDGVLSYYAPDATYNDPQVPKGLKGHDQIRAYLENFFPNSPPMSYNPEEIWPIEGGYCGRWYGLIGEDGTDGKIRGFDLCIVKDGLITHNEVYVHILDMKQA